MTIMTRKQVGAWCKEMADHIYGDPILLDIFTRAYCTKEEEPMNEVKRLRVAAGLTQQELSAATGIEIEYIAAEERGEGGLSARYWKCIDRACNNRIKMFKRDAGLTIKSG